MDGTNTGAEDSTAPYSVSWNTSGVSNGSHSITTVARDAAGKASWFAMYTYRQQAGNSVQVPAERRNYFITGVRWTSASASDQY